MSNGKTNEIKVTIPENLRAGNYANNTKITHTGEEFVLDFMLVVPPTGIVHTRIIFSPGHIKRVLNALQDNIQKYENKFGTIKAAQEPIITN